MSVIDDRTGASCLHCGELVELYAPGESYTVSEGGPMHLRCAEIVKPQAFHYGRCDDINCRECRESTTGCMRYPDAPIAAMPDLET